MMRRVKPAGFIVQLAAIFILGVATSVQAAPAENRGGSVEGSTPLVDYNRETDELKVTADDAPLRLLLTEIARQSGIEVMFDDMADGPVSVSIDSESLEDGLKRMLKGSNHMMRYSRNEEQELLLIGVMILPAGESDGSHAKRLVSMRQEAYYRETREKKSLSIEQSRQVDIASERWQSRLAELPPEVRDKMQADIEARLTKEAERRQRYEELKKKDMQRRAQRKAEMKKAEELALEALGSEQRALYEQRSREAREVVRAKLFGSQY